MKLTRKINQEGTMITHKVGDIFNEDVEAIVNPVNCVGIMGKGLALMFKHVFPSNYDAYAKACKEGQIIPGKMFTHEINRGGNLRFLIVNFPTKRHWRDLSRIEDILDGLESLKNVVTKRNIKSIALPLLGCGLGGLDKARVIACMEATEWPNDCNVIILNG